MHLVAFKNSECMHSTCMCGAHREGAAHRPRGLVPKEFDAEPERQLHQDDEKKIIEKRPDDEEWADPHNVHRHQQQRGAPRQPVKLRKTEHVLSESTARYEQDVLVNRPIASKHCLA
eukprot:5789935-Pleurochrysis_carterae.AAC.1